MILRNIVTRAMQPESENDPFSAATVGAKDFLPGFHSEKLLGFLFVYNKFPELFIMPEEV